MPNVIRSTTIPEYIYNAYNTQAKRRNYPDSYFLLVDGENKKFPYRDPESGAIHCGLLKAAITRAAQYGYDEVENKARSMYERSCKDKEKELTFKLLDVKGEEVFGVVYSPNEKDADGDEADAETIMNACYEYNTNYQSLHFRHSFPLSKEQAQLLESYIAPVDFTFNDHVVKAGSWLQRWRVKDADLQRMIREGNIVGFSLGGYVVREGA